MRPPGARLSLVQKVLKALFKLSQYQTTYLTKTYTLRQLLSPTASTSRYPVYKKYTAELVTVLILRPSFI